MISPQDDMNLRSTGLILLISFCLSLIAVGALFIRIDKKKREGGRKSPLSQYLIAGRLMIISGLIIGFVALMFFLVNISGLLG